MTEFHFEDPDLKNSTLEIEFSSCVVELDNFTDSQGKQIRTEDKESFHAEVPKQRAHKFALSLQLRSWLLKVPI